MKITEKIFNLLSKEEPKTIREVATLELYEPVGAYSDWYDVRGLQLPPAFQADPTGWTEALHKMKRAFELMYDDEKYFDSDLAKARESGDTEKIASLEKEIVEGLTLFGANLYYLTDTVKEVPPAH